jgi:hypothetical protein
MRQHGFFILTRPFLTVQEIRFIFDEPDHKTATNCGPGYLERWVTEGTVLKSAPRKELNSRTEQKRQTPVSSDKQNDY